MLQCCWRRLALRGDGPDRPPLRSARDRPGRRRGYSRRGVAAKGKRCRNPGTARRLGADDHPTTVGRCNITLTGGRDSAGLRGRADACLPAPDPSPARVQDRQTVVDCHPGGHPRAPGLPAPPTATALAVATVLVLVLAVLVAFGFVGTGLPDLEATAGDFDGLAAAAAGGQGALVTDGRFRELLRLTSGSDGEGEVLAGQFAAAPLAPLALAAAFALLGGLGHFRPFAGFPGRELVQQCGAVVVGRGRGGNLGRIGRPGHLGRLLVAAPVTLPGPL